MSQLHSWIRGNCKFAADETLSTWHTPKFEQAVQLVEAYNNLDNFVSLCSSIKNLVKKVQSTPLPQNREYSKVMSAFSQLDQIRGSVEGQARQAKQMANQGQDVMPMVSQMAPMVQPIPGLVDQVFQSIQRMKKRITAKPPKGVMAQVAPVAPPTEMNFDVDQSTPYVPAPTMAPPATPPMPAPKPTPKAKPMTSPKTEPTLFSDAEDPEMAYNELVPMLNAIKEKATAAAQVKKVDYGAQLQKMQSLFEKGKDGLFWYDKIADQLNKRLGPQGTKMFLNFVAATSPRMPVMRNLDAAIQAYNQYMSGEEFTGFMSTHVPNILRAFKGEDLSGAKVSNFAKAMSGDPNAVTLDVWMARAFGMNKDQFNPVQYQALSDAIRELASNAGVQPRQYQAAVWTGIKREQDAAAAQKGGSLTASPIDELMEQQWDKFKQDFLKYRGKSKPNPADFRLTAALEAWVKSNCSLS
jgi:hypothetical protein